MTTPGRLDELGHGEELACVLLEWLGWMCVRRGLAAMEG